MASVAVRIEAVRYGEPETGGWCDRCFLPSMVAQRVAVVYGMSVLGCVEVAWCDSCGRHDQRKVAL